MPNNSEWIRIEWTPFESGKPRSQMGLIEQPLGNLEDGLKDILLGPNGGGPLTSAIQKYIYDREAALGLGGETLDRVATVAVWMLVAEIALEQVSLAAQVAKTSGVSWRTLAQASNASSTASFIRRHGPERDSSSNSSDDR